MRVVKVSKQGDGRMTDIEITDREGTGQVHMQTWGSKTRTRKMTLTIHKSRKGTKNM